LHIYIDLYKEFEAQLYSDLSCNTENRADRTVTKSSNKVFLSKTKVFTSLQKSILLNIAVVRQFGQIVRGKCCIYWQRRAFISLLRWIVFLSYRRIHGYINLIAAFRETAKIFLSFLLSYLRKKEAKSRRVRSEATNVEVTRNNDLFVLSSVRLHYFFYL